MAIEDGAPEDYRTVEEELCRIPDVNAARIVADSTSRPIEVHILASPAKHAKQIVRDVQSVAMASFGLDLDRRIISVVQLDSLPANVVLTEPAPARSDSVPADPGSDYGPPSADYGAPSAEPRAALGHSTLGSMAPGGNGTHGPAESPRIVVDTVTAFRNGTQCSAQVSLRRDTDTSVGVAEGLLVSGSALRLVATATLNALRELEPAATRADVEMATILRLGERDVAVANVVFAVPPYEEVVSGSAIVRTAGEHDAMARAVLDATNRRLQRLEHR